LNDQAKQTDVQTYFCKPIYSENDLVDKTEASGKIYQRINALTQPATATIKNVLPNVKCVAKTTTS
jgi:hypothetical protein